MVAGHLREQNGYYQMILSWKGKDGKRKGKSISTGLPVKGNKKRAEAILLKTRKEFNPDNLMENADMLFTDFLSKWLKDKAVALGTSTYAEYAYDIKNYIMPYFQDHPIALLKMTARDLESFYRHERQQNEATANELLMYHEIIVAAFQYAVDLEWVKENIMAQVNPCADEAPILFTDFYGFFAGMAGYDEEQRGSHNVCFLLHIHQKQHHPVFPGQKAHASGPGKAPEVHSGILSARTERRAVREYSHPSSREHSQMPAICFPNRPD